MPANKSANDAIAKVKSGQLEKLKIQLNGNSIELGQYVPRAGKSLRPRRVLRSLTALQKHSLYPSSPTLVPKSASTSASVLIWTHLLYGCRSWDLFGTGRNPVSSHQVTAR